MKNNRWPVVFLLGILAVMTLVYSNHFHNEFHYDDGHTISENGYVRDLKNIPLFFRDCTTTSSMPSHQGYRPLVTATIAVDYALSMLQTKGKNGYDPFWYHVFNFSWFLLIVVLFYFVQLHLYQLVSIKNKQWFALVGCAWYGLDTANADTINYVISRSDILSTLSIMGSFALYVCFERYRKYYFYLVPVAIGMFAKETSIMFAPALVAYDFIVEEKNTFGSMFTKEGFQKLLGSARKAAVAFVVCLGLGAFGIWMTNHHVPGGDSPWTYALTETYVLLHYIVQFFFPFGQTPETDLPLITKLSDDRLYIGFAFLFLLFYVIQWTSKKKEWRLTSFGLLWFFLMLMPTSSFIPIAEVTNDHRGFLPHLGLVVALVNGMSVFWNKWTGTRSHQKWILKIAPILVLMVILSSYAFGTFQRNKVWRTEESLWKDVTEKSPNSGRAWSNYALTQMNKGEYQLAKLAFNLALQRAPRYYSVHLNLAILNDLTGNKTEAIQYFKNALALGPQYVEPYFYYARSLFNMGKIDEAEKNTNLAIAIYPKHLLSRYLQMQIFLYKKQWNDLERVSKSVLEVYPDDLPSQTFLGLAQNQGQLSPRTIDADMGTTQILALSPPLYNNRRFQDVIETGLEALKLSPNNADAYNNICAAWVQLNQPVKAIPACDKAIALNSKLELAKGNLEQARKLLLTGP